MYTCIIVDDQQHAADLIKKHVLKIPQLSIMLTATDSIEALTFLDNNKPDIIFLDVEMPGIDGIVFTTGHTAGLNDAKVAPWQPAKVVAKMQQVSKGSNVVLFRVADSGHFDYPSDADVYSFLFRQLGYPDFKPKKAQSPKKEQ
jgi:CheY-like chemotaxis protein